MTSAGYAFLPGTVEKPYNRLSANYEGYPGMLVRLSQADLDEMAELVIESWRVCAPKCILASYDAAHPPVS